MKKSFYILASIIVLLLSSPIFAQADPGGDPDKTIGSYTGSICAGTSYTWPANGQVYTTTQSGVTVVNGDNIATLNLTVISVPSAGANGSLVICAGTSVDATALFGALTGTPATGGTWSATTGGAGTYTYTQVGASPCGNNTAIVTVTEQAAPASAGANGSLLICAGTSVDATALYGALTGTPATGGTWSATTGGAGTYTYTQAATSPCTVNNTATVTVTEQAAPASAGANGSLVICAGTSVDATALYGALTGTPSIGGTWSATSGGAGTYTYTQAGTLPCGNNTATVTVTEQAAPASAGANGSLLICAGTSVDATALYGALTGTPATGGTWSATAGGAGTYTYTQAATSPCTVNNTATVTVTEQAVPNAGTSGTLSLASAPSDADLFVAITGEDTGGSWSRPLSGFVGVYTYTVNATFPCTGSDTSTVLVTASTQIPASPVAYCDKKLVGDVTAGTTLKFYKDIKPATVALALTEKLKAQTYYVTETVNNVESTPRVPVVVNLTALVAPTTIASTEAKVICKYMGTPNLVTFTTTPVSGASNYTWNVSSIAGATIVGNATGESITVSFEGVSGTPALIGSVTVDSNNALGCPSGKPKALALTTKAPTAAKSVALTYNGVAVKKAGNFVHDGTKTLTLTVTDPSLTADHYDFVLPEGVNNVTGATSVLGSTTLYRATYTGTSTVLTFDLGLVAAANTPLVFTCTSVGGCASSSKSLSVARAEAGTPKGLVLTDATLADSNAIPAVLPIVLKKLDSYTGSWKTRTLTLTATPNATAGSEATSYKWVLPAGVTTSTATIVEGQANTYTSDSNVISVALTNVGADTALTFKVYGVNGNGASLASKDLACTSAAPKAPAGIFSGATGSGTAFAYHPSCGTVTVSVPAVPGIINTFESISGGAVITGVEDNKATINLSATSAIAKSTITIRATATTATGSNYKDFVIKLGTPCGAGRMISEEIVANDFNVIAYPNPSTEGFKVKSGNGKSFGVQVYDMLGRSIEQRQMSSDAQIGSNYAKGIYNVIVNQGANVKTLRVIKQ